MKRILIEDVSVYYNAEENRHQQIYHDTQKVVFEISSDSASKEDLLEIALRGIFNFITLSGIIQLRSGMKYDIGYIYESGNIDIGAIDCKDTVVIEFHSDLSVSGCGYGSSISKIIVAE